MYHARRFISYGRSDQFDKGRCLTIGNKLAFKLDPD